MTEAVVALAGERFSPCLTVMALCTLCVLGCEPDGSRSRRAETKDSAGVTIVMNTSNDQALSWSLTQRLTLGGEDDGPAGLSGRKVLGRR